jgi:hypothetical protein
MRWRLLTWICLSLVIFAAGLIGYFSGRKPLPTAPLDPIGLEISPVSEPKKTEAIRANSTTRDEVLAQIITARLSQDPQWLEKAAALYPNNPSLLLAQYEQAVDDVSRSVLLTSFRQVEPDNALGPFLEAGIAARQGDPTALARALTDAALSPDFNRHELALLLATEKTLRDSGLTDAEAMVQASQPLAPSTLNDLEQVGKGMGELQRVLIGLGEWDEADFLLEQTLNLSGRLQSEPLLADNFAGLVIESQLLGALDPETVIDWQGTRAGDRLQMLDQEWVQLRQAARTLTPARRETLTPAEWAAYRERLATQGERAALEALVEER